MTTPVRLRFEIDADASGFIRDINKANAAVDSLRSSAVGASKQSLREYSSALVHIEKQLHASLKESGQFTSVQKNILTQGEAYAKTLGRQKLSLREGVAALREYHSEYGKLNGKIAQAARQQARVEQSLVTASQRNASGAINAGISTPLATLPKTREGVANAVAQRVATPIVDIKSQATQAQETTKALQVLNETYAQSSRALVNWGKNIQWAGRQMMVGLSIPIGLAVGAATASFLQLDKEIVRIQKVYGSDLKFGAEFKEQAEMVREESMKTARELAKTMAQSGETTLKLTADLAATGLEGEELQRSVIETSRLALLGEVDNQEAMKATLALQTAFKLNTQELAEAVDFFNAVENQTSTSLQDLVEAIPRVGPVIHNLGGGIEDLAVLMTALREGGVSAAEGANALKSGLSAMIAPTKNAIETAEKYGISLKGIYEANKGELMPMILELQKQLSKLSSPDQQEVLTKIFGRYQVGRITALFNNLNVQGSQTAKVATLMAKSASELRQIAEQEQAAMMQSASHKWQSALEQLKISLSDIGETFIGPLTWVVEKVTWLVNKIASLPDAVKNAGAALLTVFGIIGPIVMTVGVLANLLGTILSGFAGIHRMLHGIKKFEFATPELMAAKQLADNFDDGFVSSTNAVKALNEALAKTTELVENITRKSARMFTVNPNIASDTFFNAQKLGQEDARSQNFQPVIYGNAQNNQDRAHGLKGLDPDWTVADFKDIQSRRPGDLLQIGVTSAIMEQAIIARSSTDPEMKIVSRQISGATTEYVKEVKRLRDAGQLTETALKRLSKEFIEAAGMQDIVDRERSRMNMPTYPEEVFTRASAVGSTGKSSSTDRIMAANFAGAVAAGVEDGIDRVSTAEHGGKKYPLINDPLYGGGLISPSSTAIPGVPKAEGEHITSVATMRDMFGLPVARDGVNPVTQLVRMFDSLGVSSEVVVAQMRQMGFDIQSVSQSASTGAKEFDTAARVVKDGASVVKDIPALRKENASKTLALETEARRKLEEAVVQARKQTGMSPLHGAAMTSHINRLMDESRVNGVVKASQLEAKFQAKYGDQVRQQLVSAVKEMRAELGKPLYGEALSGHVDKLLRESSVNGRVSTQLLNKRFEREYGVSPNIENVFDRIERTSVSIDQLGQESKKLADIEGKRRAAAIAAQKAHDRLDFGNFAQGIQPRYREMPSALLSATETFIRSIPSTLNTALERVSASKTDRVASREGALSSYYSRQRSFRSIGTLYMDYAATGVQAAASAAVKGFSAAQTGMSRLGQAASTLGSQLSAGAKATALALQKHRYAIGGAATALSMGGMFLKTDGTSTAATASNIAAMAGMGAGIGTMISPIIGTAIGATLGGTVGYIQKLGEKADQAANKLLELSEASRMAVSVSEELIVALGGHKNAIDENTKSHTDAILASSANYGLIGDYKQLNTPSTISEYAGEMRENFEKLTSQDAIGAAMTVYSELLNKNVSQNSAKQFVQDLLYAAKKEEVIFDVTARINEFTAAKNTLDAENFAARNAITASAGFSSKFTEQYRANTAVIGGGPGEAPIWARNVLDNGNLSTDMAALLDPAAYAFAKSLSEQISAVFAVDQAWMPYARQAGQNFGKVFSDTAFEAVSNTPKTNRLLGFNSDEVADVNKIAKAYLALDATQRAEFQKLSNRHEEFGKVVERESDIAAEAMLAMYPPELSARISALAATMTQGENGMTLWSATMASAAAITDESLRSAMETASALTLKTGSLESAIAELSKQPGAEGLVSKFEVLKPLIDQNRMSVQEFNMSLADSKKLNSLEIDAAAVALARAQMLGLNLDLEEFKSYDGKSISIAINRKINTYLDNQKFSDSVNSLISEGQSMLSTDSPEEIADQESADSAAETDDKALKAAEKAASDSQKAAEKAASNRQKAAEKAAETAQKFAQKISENRIKGLEKEVEKREKIMDKMISVSQEAYQKQIEAAQKAFEKEIELRQKAAEKQFEIQINQLRRQADEAQKARDLEIKNLNEAFKQRQKELDSQSESLKKFYDDQIEAINEQEKAERKKEDAARRAEEAEKRRISRAKELLDLQLAMAEGVARGDAFQVLSAQMNMSTARENWAVEDKSLAEEEERRLRDEAREQELERLAKERDAKIEALEAVSVAEQEAHDKRIELLEEESRKKQEEDEKAIEWKRAVGEAMLEIQREQDALLIEQRREYDNGLIEAKREADALHVEQEKAKNAAMLEAEREKDAVALEIMKSMSDAKLEAQREADSAALEAQKEADSARLEGMRESASESAAIANGTAETIKHSQQKVSAFIDLMWQKTNGDVEAILTNMQFKFGVTRDEAIKMFAAIRTELAAALALMDEWGIAFNVAKVFADQIAAGKITISQVTPMIQQERAMANRAPGKASGGLIVGPGTPTSDSIPALLSNGEYVVRASAVAKYGVGLLESINAKKFASGGAVGTLPGATAAVGVSALQVTPDKELVASANALGEARTAADKAAMQSDAELAEQKRRNAITAVNDFVRFVDSVNGKYSETIANQINGISSVDKAGLAFFTARMSEDAQMRSAKIQSLSDVTKASAVSNAEQIAQNSQLRGQQLDTFAQVMTAQNADAANDKNATNAKIFNAAGLYKTKTDLTNAITMQHAVSESQMQQQTGVTTSSAISGLQSVAATNKAVVDANNVRWVDSGRVTNDVIKNVAETLKSSFANINYDALVKMVEAYASGKTAEGDSLKTQVMKRASGGYVSGPGSGTSDSIPALLSNGEYVIRQRSVVKYGASMLDSINAGRFAEGGMVGAISTGISSAVNKAIEKRIQDAIINRSSDFAQGSNGVMIDWSKVPKGAFSNPFGFWTSYSGGNHGADGRGARDYQAGLGAPIRPAGPGVISRRVGGSYPDTGNPGDGGGGGNWLIIDHNVPGKGVYSSVYMHLKQGSLNAQVGDVVDTSNVIGQVGNSGSSQGAHLHFEFAPGAGQVQRAMTHIFESVTGATPVSYRNNATGEIGGPGLFSFAASNFDKTKIGAQPSSWKFTPGSVSDTTLMTSTASPWTGAAIPGIIPSVMRWANLVQDTMKELKIPNQYLSGILKQMQQESSGNPNAINLWDSNARAGTPSKGLLQVIEPTFLAYARANQKDAKLMTDPSANIYAALNYVLARYGLSKFILWNSGQNQGYASGGLVVPALRRGATINYDNTLANLHRGETVLTAPLTRQLKDNVAGSGDVSYNVTVNIDKASATASEIESAVFSALDKHSRKMGRSRAVGVR